MVVIQRVVKATTRKGKKVLLKKEPQILEEAKRVLFLQGRKSSERVRRLSKDLYNLKKPDALRLNRKHDVTVFENAQPVENICGRHEAPLFVLSSNSKKRPDNLVVGRMYNSNLLDMVEFHVEDYQGLNDFSTDKIALGVKPCLVFNGPTWDDSDELKQLKSLFVDLFHREHVENVSLQGIQHCISFTITPEKKISIRSYKIVKKKSGTRVPRVELEEMGPRVDLSIRRSKLPSEDLLKEALRKPQELKVAKKKNITTDGLGTTHGRIHLGKQEIQKLQTRKMKGLKKTNQERKSERKGAAKRAPPPLQNNNGDRPKRQKMG